MRFSGFLLGMWIATLACLGASEPGRDLPAEIEGLALWLIADEGVEFHEGVGNGMIVKEWKSKVGGLSANQTLGDLENRTVRSLRDGDSKESMHFRGNSTLRVPSSFNLKDSTVFVSIQNQLGQPFQRILSFPTGLSNQEDFNSNDGLAFFVDSNSSSRAALESGGIKAVAPDYTPSNTWNVLGYRIDGTGNMTVSANKTPGLTRRNSFMAASNSGEELLIGHSRRETTAEKLDEARIHEILIFNRALEAEELELVADYMRASMEAEVPELAEPPVVEAVSRNATLSSVALSGGRVVDAGNATVSGNFVWASPEARVLRSGNQTVVFRPDLAKYTRLEFPVFVVVKPELMASPSSFGPFKVPSGIASEVRSFRVEGSNLTAEALSANLGGDATFEISLDGVENFSKSLTIPVEGGAVSREVFARVSASAVEGNALANISLAAGNASASVSLNATVFTTNSSVIVADPESLSGFSTQSGNRSASRELVVRGYNLTNNITALAPEGWEVSSDNITFSRTAEIPVTGSAANGTLLVRMDGSGPLGVREGKLSLSHSLEFILSTEVSLQGNLEEDQSQPPPPSPSPSPSPPPPPPPPDKCNKKEASKKKKACKGKKKDKAKGKKKGKGKKKKPLFENNSDKRKGVGPVPVAQSGSTLIMSDGSIRRAN